ncbi:MAG TPA: hypothetical protein ENJ52_10395 [Aliiroseovarius sp.]|nr:hypothetical protein [Aliiroseovarius sp.]
MKLTKRTLMGATLALALTPLAAFAEGSEDPIPGIDVIIEKDPSAVPVMKFTLNDGEMQKFNSLKGKERAEFLAGVLTRYLLDLGPKSSPDDLRAMLVEGMGGSWCGPCRLVDGAYVNRIKLPGEGLAVEIKGIK